jgi:hypothetical protein
MLLDYCEPIGLYLVGEMRHNTLGIDWLMSPRDARQ